MSLRRSFEIVCDRCGASLGHVKHGPGKRVKAVRERLAKLGWTKDPQRRGVDYCEKCPSVSDSP